MKMEVSEQEAKAILWERKFNRKANGAVIILLGLGLILAQLGNIVIKDAGFLTLLMLAYLAGCFFYLRKAFRKWGGQIQDEVNKMRTAS